MVDSDDTKYYPTQFLVNTDSFGFLISESKEEHNYHKTKEGIMNRLISESSKAIDFDRAKQFHCELCQNCHWKKLKPFQDHISQLHPDIQGEFVDFHLVPDLPNNYNPRIIKFVKEDIIKKLISESSKTMNFDRAKIFNCELCQKDWKKWKPLQDHIYKLHSDIQGELKDFPLQINGRYETVLKFLYRKKSNKYACEVCQKDWDSLNDLEKHLKENHTGVKGGLKIDVAYGKTIIKYVKNHVKDSDNISIGLDTSNEVTNDQGKEDIINDPEERDEESTVQGPFNVPMDREKSYKYTCEVCQKDWDSMNDLEKHLRENHPRVKGELKIKVSYGKTIIGFVKKVWDSIPIGLDTTNEAQNDQAKEGIINDPEEQDEGSNVQEPLNVPMDRKKLEKYACELCQKDWDSMNDLEKHLKENHSGVKGELKIDVAYRKTIIKFVKNHVKDTNDQGKEDIIDDPGERDEQNIVQNPLNAPMDVKHQKPDSNICPRKMKTKESSVMHNNTNISDFVKDIEFSDDIKPKFEANEKTLKVESSGIDQKPNMVDSIMPNDKEMIDFVHDIEFSDNIKPKLDIKEETLDMKSSSSGIKRKSEFTEETLKVKSSKNCPHLNLNMDQKPEKESSVMHNDTKILDFVQEIKFSDDIKPKFEAKEETLKVENSGNDHKPNMVDPIMPNDMKVIDFVHDIEFSDNIKPKLDIKEETLDIKRKSEFMEETLNVKRSKIDQKPDIVNSMVLNNKETIDLVHDIEFSDDVKPKLEIKEEPMSMESSSASVNREAEFMENCSELFKRVLKGKGTLEEMLIYKRLLDKQ